MSVFEHRLVNRLLDRTITAVEQIKGIVEYNNLHPRSPDDLVSSSVMPWALSDPCVRSHRTEECAHTLPASTPVQIRCSRWTNLVLLDNYGEYWFIWFWRWIRFRSERDGRSNQFFFFFFLISFFDRSCLQLQQTVQARALGENTYFSIFCSASISLCNLSYFYSIFLLYL